MALLRMTTPEQLKALVEAEDRSKMSEMLMALLRMTNLEHLKPAVAAESFQRGNLQVDLPAHLEAVGSLQMVHRVVLVVVEVAEGEAEAEARLACHPYHRQLHGQKPATVCAWWQCPDGIALPQHLLQNPCPDAWF